jgi:predicted ATPase/class 3 adenylate cyclase
MASLPTGSVTVLFTDIEGSTRLLQQHPDEYGAAIARHHQILRSAVERHQGAIFQQMGDAICAVFTDPGDAIAAGMDSQYGMYIESWGVVESINVRVAIHSGDVEEHDGHYFGLVLHQCARLTAATHGGQVVISAQTARLAAHSLPSGAALRDLGLHRLKDLPTRERVYQLVGPGLRSEFPPLRTIEDRPFSLPTQPTPFIGREREVAAVQRLIARTDIRHVTLTGPGVTGKTRLVIEVARGCVDDYAGGVCFVALGTITDPALVASSLLRALGEGEVAGKDHMDILIAYLRPRQMLLILDNFEQVMPAAPMVTELLAAAPSLTILVTSRERLHVSSEYDFDVPPMSLPDRHQATTLADMLNYETIRLFRDRAQAARADFVLSAAHAPAVAEICHRLDGLPLAIELAAAHVRILPLPTLLARLDRRFPLLTRGPSDLPARQRTLRGAIAWSHDLLDVAGQQLFRRLSVFVSGCTLDAAEVVLGHIRATGGSHESAPHEVIQPLRSTTSMFDELVDLVDKSLLRQAEGRDGEPRFVMLETLREFATEQLAQSDDANAVAPRHAAYYKALAERADSQFFGPDQLVWLNRLETEHDNLVAALDWYRANDTVAGLELAGKLAQFWELRGLRIEGRRWLSGFLVATQGDTPARARAFLGEGVLAAGQGEFGQSNDLCDRSLAVFQKLGDRHGIAQVYLRRGAMAQLRGSYSQAQTQLDQCLVIFQELGDRRGAGQAYHHLGILAAVEGDYDIARAHYDEALKCFEAIGHYAGIGGLLGQQARLASIQADYGTARRFYEEALELARRHGDRPTTGWTLAHLGNLTRMLTEYRQAHVILDESLALFREIGDKRGESNVYHHLGHLAAAEGNLRFARQRYEEARTLYQLDGATLLEGIVLGDLGNLARLEGDVERALTLWRECAGAVRVFPDNRWCMGWTLGNIGVLFTQLGLHAEGTRLIAAASAWHKYYRLSLDPDERDECDVRLAGARGALGPVAYVEAWREGQAMLIHDAFDYALGIQLSPENPSSASADGQSD